MATIATVMATTIQISMETKDLINTFGNKEDTYDDIVRRLYDFAVKQQLKEFLYSSKNSVPIDEAIKEIEKKWPRSK